MDRFSVVLIILNFVIVVEIIYFYTTNKFTADVNNSLDINISPHVSPSTPTKTKLMFFKTHKCGTSSLVTILYMYGIRRNLTFLLTPYEHQFYNDRPPQSLGERYDILCQHHRLTSGWDHFRPGVVNPRLPRNETFYFTILRNPEEQFVSNFQYFDHDIRILKSHPGAGVNEVLGILFKEVSKTKRLICDRVFNPMSFDLGFTRFQYIKSISRLSEEKQMHIFIRYLESQFDLIMIMEHFDVSLIFLMHSLNWSIEDIAYMKKMPKSYSDFRNASFDSVLSERAQTDSKSLELSEENLNLLRKHNRLDIKVYQHFATKLKMKSEVSNQTFLKGNLVKLQDQRGNLSVNCSRRENDESLIERIINLKRFLSSDNRENPDCELWYIGDVFISKALSAKQDPNFSEAYSHVLRENNVNFVDYESITWAVNLFDKIRLQYLNTLV